ncbi:MAG: UDP-N-acetylmuramate dehydrogenase [Deltaproteobacteria bacterium]|nr:UDP-N-acetylmuramate dehydrogenase [Deltaproteobacteria bacterium]
MKDKTCNLQPLFTAYRGRLATCNFKGRILFDVLMKEWTSMKIGGPTDVMAFPLDEDDLQEILKFAYVKDFPVFLLGAGTNLVVRDGGIRGVVINLADGFKDLYWQADDYVVAGAGVKLAKIVNECSKRGLSGLEFAVQIPGTIGGVVAMNAGAYGADVGSLVAGIDVTDTRGSKIFIRRDELHFSYRSCSLKPDYIITRVHLKFKKGDVSIIEKQMNEFIKRREKTQSVRLPNAGSIFKNPEGLCAGKLIDEVGLKGARIGDAMVSDVHANYIVNLGDAKTKDVLLLINIIKDRVLKEKGVLLEEEIKIVGEE